MAVQAPFKRGWWGVELPGYRDVEFTYGGCAFDALPPIEETLDGSLSWLKRLDGAARRAMEPHWRHDPGRHRINSRFALRAAEARRRGFELPETFVTFMTSEDLRRRIPSCTACHFDAPEKVVEAPAPGEGILFRFLNDQQGCLYWSLYVERNGAHAVVVSDRAFDFDDEQAVDAPAELWLCADDFESFLCRFRLENDLWFVLNERHREPTPAERRYLDHYRR